MTTTKRVRQQRFGGERVLSTKQLVALVAAATVGSWLGCQQASAASYTWDASGAATTAPTDGSGTWDTASLNWNDGTVNHAWNNAGNDTAVFGNNNGNAGTVTLNTGITVGGLTFNTAGSGNYTVAGNTLTFGTAATITTNANATIGSTLAGNVAVTQSGPGTLTLTGVGSSIGVPTFNGNVVVDGGSLTVADNGYIGKDSAGTLTIQNGASFTATGSGSGATSLNVGGESAVKNGTVNQLGGTVTTDGSVNLGRFLSTGTYNLSNGTLTIGRNLNVGVWTGSTGIMNQSGGTVEQSAGIYVAIGGESSGIYNLSNGTVNANYLAVGKGGPGRGTFVQTGGDVSAAGEVWLSDNNTATGNTAANTYTMTGGTLRTTWGINLGVSGSRSGDMNIDGTAAVIMRNSSSIIFSKNATTGNYTVNQNGGSVGFYSDSAGVTPGGNGKVNLGASGSNGIYSYNLNGGTLAANMIQSTNRGATGQAIFNFNGGTLKSNYSTTTFMQGLTAANVYGGGAIIDTNGQNITIAQALLGTTGKGVDSVTVTDGGSSYAVAPTVTFSGDGSGATGYAVLTNGVVSRVVITNPGTGYTSAPAISFDSGAAAATATANLNNANGGFTKAGTGTLILSAANTYTGKTTVKGGTLMLGASGSISSSPLVEIDPGAAFDTTTQSLAMSASQSFSFGLDPAGNGSAGLLNAAALNIDGGVVDFAAVGALDDAAYVFARYTSLTGSAFATVNGLPSGYALDYHYQNANEIALVAVPEPTVVGLAGLVALGFAGRRRRM